MGSAKQELKDLPKRGQSRAISKPLDDHATPNLQSLMVCEALKWGSVLFVLFIIYRFLEPGIQSFYAVVVDPAEDVKESATE